MVEKVEKRFKKKVESQDIVQNLTTTEREILHLLTNEFLTVKQTAIRRGTSVQSVYKIVKKIKQKGLMTRGFKEVEKKDTTFKPFTNNYIRLHAQQFNIKILFKDERYKQTLAKSNTVNIDGNTIRLFADGLEVYSGQDFYAEDVQKATYKSIKYWNRLFVKLEHEFNILILKPRTQNIKLVHQGHYAETNNELAEEVEKKGIRINVYTTDSGKLWLTFDNSLNLSESETLNPSTAKQDMGDTVKPFFNDMRDNPHYLPSEIRESIKDTVKIVYELAAAQQNQTKLMETMLPKPIKETSIKKERPDYVG